MRANSLTNLGVALDYNVASDYDKVLVVAGLAEEIEALAPYASQIGEIVANLPDVLTVQEASELVNNLTVKVTTLPAGSTATSELVGTEIRLGIPAGTQGAQGIQGPKGDKGDRGDIGLTGAKGPAGATGPQGPKGNTGNHVHHIKGTSTTDDKGDFGASGEIDTYTVYGDASETINLGFFIVRNGYDAYNYAIASGYLGTKTDFFLELANLRAYSEQSQLNANAAALSASQVVITAGQATTAASASSSSASSASASASTSTTKASEALSSANNASNSASIATTKAAEALSSASTASTAASSATVSATNASTSASAALVSASTSVTKATEAATSASTALGYKNDVSTMKLAIEIIYDTFDDRFLGTKTTNPLVDNDGNALLDGALYFDTTTNAMKVYDVGTTTWYSMPQIYLNSLLDVELTSLTTGNILVWNGTKWINYTLSKADVGLNLVDNTADSAKNVLSATKLKTARTINGVSFDGSANITIVDSTKAPLNNPVFTGGITEKVYNLTGTAISPANGTIQYKTVSSNTTFTETLAAGQSVILRLVNANSYTITFPTITWVGAVAPTLTANCAIVVWKEQSTLYGAYVGTLV